MLPVRHDIPSSEELLSNRCKEINEIDLYVFACKYRFNDCNDINYNIHYYKQIICIEWILKIK